AASGATAAAYGKNPASTAAVTTPAANRLGEDADGVLAASEDGAGVDHRDLIAAGFAAAVAAHRDQPAGTAALAGARAGALGINPVGRIAMGGDQPVVDHIDPAGIPAIPASAAQRHRAGGRTATAPVAATAAGQHAMAALAKRLDHRGAAQQHAH